MYAYILPGKVRTLLQWADGLLSNEYDNGWMDWVRGVMTSRALAILINMLYAHIIPVVKALDNSQEEVWKEDYKGFMLFLARSCFRLKGC